MSINFCFVAKNLAVDWSLIWLQYKKTMLIQTFLHCLKWRVVDSYDKLHHHDIAGTCHCFYWRKKQTQKNIDLKQETNF